MALMLDVDGSSYIGARSYQEDAIWWDRNPANSPWLGVISDGMGGHAAGDKASKLAVRTISEVFVRAFSQCGDVSTALKQAVETAHTAVLEEGIRLGHKHNMGATVVAFSVYQDRLYWCSAGDSRLYLVRNRQAHQLTTDFTFETDLMEAVRNGNMTREEVANNPQRNALTSFLGVDRPLRLDLNTMELANGDFLISCTDGVHGLFDEKDFVKLCQGTAVDVVERLFTTEIANRAKKNQDNATALVARLYDKAAAVAAPVSKSIIQPRMKQSAAPSNKLGVYALICVLVTVVAGASWLLWSKSQEAYVANETSKKLKDENEKVTAENERLAKVANDEQEKREKAQANEAKAQANEAKAKANEAKVHRLAIEKEEALKSAAKANEKAKLAQQREAERALAALEGKKLSQSDVKKTPKAGAKEVPKAGAKEVPKVEAKEVPKVEAKEVPKVEAKEVPKVEAKEVPKVEAKEVPKVEAKEVPKVEAKEVPKVEAKEVPKVEAKEVPKAGTKEVPKAGTKGQLI
jgi:serine/threonine protein phosphatase PrpC